MSSGKDDEFRKSVPSGVSFKFMRPTGGCVSNCMIIQGVA